MNAQDVELIDRITGREGVCELYLVASQIDTQLFGSEKAKYGGRLPDVLAGLKAVLARQAQETLMRQMQDSTIGTGALRKLHDESEARLIVASGVCKTLLVQPEATWDSNAKHVWSLLNKNYPDYFGDVRVAKPHLETLTSNSELLRVLMAVRVKKDKIVEDRLVPYLQGQNAASIGYQNALIKEMQSMQARLEHADIEAVNQQLEQLKIVRSKGANAASEAFLDAVEEFGINLPGELRSAINSCYKRTKEGVSSAESTERESYRVKGDGFGNWIAGLWGGGYETSSRSVRVVRAGPVREAILEFRDDIENKLLEIVEKSSQKWRIDLKKQVLASVRKSIDDEHIDADTLSQACRRVVGSMKALEKPKFPALPSEVEGKSGTLSDSQAEEYIHSASDYLRILKNAATHFAEETKLQIEQIAKSNLAEQLFQKYEQEFQELKLQVEAKKLTLERYKDLIQELNGVE